MREVFEFPPEGMGQEVWGVPRIIKKLPARYLIPFIRGVFDAEGDVSPESSTSPYVGFSQKNRDLLEFVRSVLNELGIETGEVFVADPRD